MVVLLLVEFLIIILIVGRISNEKLICAQANGSNAYKLFIIKCVLRDQSYKSIYKYKNCLYIEYHLTIVLGSKINKYQFPVNKRRVNQSSGQTSGRAPPTLYNF